MKKPYFLLLLIFLSSLWAKEIVLDLQSVKVSDILARLSKETTQEIITAREIKKEITGSIRCSTLEEALNALCLLYPNLRWTKLVFPAGEKVSNEDIVLTARALKLVKIPKVIAVDKGEDLLFMRSSRASLGERNLRTVYVVWEEMGIGNLAEISSLQTVKLTPQDYLNMNWLMLNAFLSMTPEERKQVLLGSFSLIFRDPTLLQRMMQESLSTLMTLSPEEMGQLVGASLRAMQAIPPEFWNQMMQSMGQFMNQMGPQIQQMVPQMQGGANQ
ncbi:MAG: hypothetical protein ACPLPS_05895 [bacterium]